MLVKTNAGTVHGVDSIPITIEVNVGGVLVGSKINYFFVGLPDSAIKEGYQRIESAIRSLGCRVPRQKIVVNMAPAARKAVLMTCLLPWEFLHLQDRLIPTHSRSI